MIDWRDYGNGIIAVDSGYVRPLLAAIHLVVEKNHVAFIDTGTNDTLPNALSALEKLGLNKDAVDYIILTHIHLDHAGGAGLMMQTFQNAKLVVHTRGARHMAEPSKLIAGVSAVYGPEYVKRVFGEILPVPPERIISATDGHVISLNQRKLVCLDTPGHARHHICILDELTGGIFTGDMFGLSYRETDVNERQFIFPTTTPSQFDPTAMHSSIERLLDLSPPMMFLTHYGQLHEVFQHGKDLQRRLDALIDIAVTIGKSDPDRHKKIKSAMAKYLISEIRNHGCVLPLETIQDIWETDLELNTQGLVNWLETSC